MGQEDYLNNLLNSVVDKKENPTELSENKEDLSTEEYFEQADLAEALEESEEKNKMLEQVEINSENLKEENLNKSKTDEEKDPKGEAFVNGEEDPIGDVFAEGEDEPIGDVFAKGEEEPIGDEFVEGEDEPIGDVFAEGEDEPIGDEFVEGEDEPIGDVFAEGEEEPIGDEFVEGEDEPIGDVFAEGEEEPIGDVFAEGEDEPMGDIFAEGDDDSIGDVFAEVEDDLIGDVFAEEEKSEAINDGDALLSNIDNILDGVEGINDDAEQLTTNEVDDLADLEPDINDDTLEVGSELLEKDEVEDLFSSMNGEEEPLTVALDSLDSTEEATSNNLFDEDLMKLLGDEDLSGEDFFASNEEEIPTELDNKENSVKSANDSKEKEKKQVKKEGLFSKLFKGKNAGKTNSENEEIFEELSKKEKSKKSKKRKPKKEKKAKKEKKPKKPKAPKPEVIEEPSAPLHKGQVIGVFVLCISVGILIMIGVNLIPYSLNIKTAKSYYEREEYTKAYDELEGLTIKEGDQAFYNKLQTIMLLKNQLNTYEAYVNLGLKPEALSALLKGVAKYDEHYADAQQYGISTNYDNMLEQITNELNTNFAVSIDMARNINTLQTQEEYSAQIYSIAK